MNNNNNNSNQENQSNSNNLRKTRKSLDINLINQIHLLKGVKSVQEIATTLNLSKRTIYRQIKNFDEGLTFVKIKPGRKFINADQLNTEIKKIVQEDAGLTQNGIKEI